MAWKGLALNSELAMIIGCRNFSDFLVRGISAIVRIGSKGHTARFSAGFEKGVRPFPPRSIQDLVASREVWRAQQRCG